MKKKFLIRRVMSLVLVFALLTSIIAGPVSAVSGNEDEYTLLEVCVEKTSLKRDPYEKAETMGTVHKDAILFCKSSTVNKYGNVWYECLYFPDADAGNTDDSTGARTVWVYSEKVSRHECEFEGVEDCEELTFCRCGAIAYKPTDLSPVGYAEALNPSVLPDLAEVLAGLGLSIEGALVAATPYVVVGAICGLTVYLAVTVANHAATVEKVATDWKKLDKDFRPERGDYYNGFVSGAYLIINRADPMNLKKALSRMDAYIAANALTKKVVQWFIYTYHEFDAYDLVDAYVTTRTGFTFNCLIDLHDSGNLMRQYKHYHISHIFDPMGHVPGHIAFGAPLQDTYNLGAWA